MSVLSEKITKLRKSDVDFKMHKKESKNNLTRKNQNYVTIHHYQKFTIWVLNLKLLAAKY